MKLTIAFTKSNPLLLNIIICTSQPLSIAGDSIIISHSDEILRWLFLLWGWGRGLFWTLLLLASNCIKLQQVNYSFLVYKWSTRTSVVCTTRQINGGNFKLNGIKNFNLLFNISGEQHAELFSTILLKIQQ